MKKDYVAELTAAIDAVDEQHRKIQGTGEPRLLRPLMRDFQGLFKTILRLQEEATGSTTDEEKVRIMTAIAPRLMRSTKELQKSMAHLVRIFGAHVNLLTVDPDKLPRA